MTHWRVREFCAGEIKYSHESVATHLAVCNDDRAAFRETVYKANCL